MSEKNDFKLFTNVHLNSENRINNIVDEIKINKYKNSIFCFLPEHTSPFIDDTNERKRLISFLDENNLKFYHIVASYPVPETTSQYPNNNFIQLYWPTYVLHETKYQIESSYGSEIAGIKVEKKFNKLFYIFNSRSHLHRCMMMDELSKYNLLDYGLYSWNQINEEFNFLYWKQKLNNVDSFWRGNNHTIYYTEELLNMGCLFSIVGESTTRTLYSTEKTFKNFLIEQPFICYGYKGQNSVLKKYGFLLYDEIIDYSFDEFDNLSDRIGGLVRVLDKFKQSDYDEIYNKIKDIVIYNKERALEILKRDSFLPQTFRDFYIDDKNQFNILGESFIHNIKNSILHES